MEPGIVEKCGVYGAGAFRQTLLSVAAQSQSLGGRVVTGCAGGQLYQWSNRNCTLVVKAHNGPVSALAPCSAGFASGSKDGTVHLWSHDLIKLLGFEISLADVRCCFPGAGSTQSLALSQ